MGLRLGESCEGWGFEAQREGGREGGFGLICVVEVEFWISCGYAILSDGFVLYAMHVRLALFDGEW